MTQQEKLMYVGSFEPQATFPKTNKKKYIIDLW